MNDLSSYTYLKEKKNKYIAFEFLNKLNSISRPLNAKSVTKNKGIFCISKSFIIKIMRIKSI